MHDDTDVFKSALTTTAGAKLKRARTCAAASFTRSVLTVTIFPPELRDHFYRLMLGKILPMQKNLTTVAYRSRTL